MVCSAPGRVVPVVGHGTSGRGTPDRAVLPGAGPAVARTGTATHAFEQPRPSRAAATAAPRCGQWLGIWPGLPDRARLAVHTVEQQLAGAARGMSAQQVCGVVEVVHILPRETRVVMPGTLRRA